MKTVLVILAFFLLACCPNTEGRVQYKWEEPPHFYLANVMVGKAMCVVRIHYPATYHVSLWFDSLGKSKDYTISKKMYDTLKYDQMLGL